MNAVELGLLHAGDQAAASLESDPSPDQRTLCVPSLGGENRAVSTCEGAPVSTTREQLALFLYVKPPARSLPDTPHFLGESGLKPS